MQIIPDKEIYQKVEFACECCIAMARQKRPQIHNCAWRGIDNEYCPMMKTKIVKLFKDKRALSDVTHPPKNGGRGVV